MKHKIMHMAVGPDTSPPLGYQTESRIRALAARAAIRTRWTAEDWYPSIKDAYVRGLTEDAIRDVVRQCPDPHYFHRALKMGLLDVWVYEPAPALDGRVFDTLAAALRLPQLVDWLARRRRRD